MRPLFATALTVAAVALPGCANDHDAIRALREEGYVQVDLGPTFRAGATCESGEKAFGFKARLDGRPMRGNVCCGMLGGCQVQGQLDENREISERIEAFKDEVERRRARLDEQLAREKAR